MGRVKDGWQHFVERANEQVEVIQMISGWDRIVQFNIIGETPFYLTFASGKIVLSDGLHEKPDLTLKGAEDVFYRLMTGELDGMKAFMLGQFKFEGQLKDAAKFAQIGETVRKPEKSPP